MPLIKYERALGPHILLFLLIGISKFLLTNSKFRYNMSKFRLNNSKFRLNNSKFRLIISIFRHKISKFRLIMLKCRHIIPKFRLNNSKFRLNILKFQLNSSKFRLNNSKFRLKVLKFRLIISKFWHEISWMEFTPGNLIRGSRWLNVRTQNLYANLRPWLTRHPNVNKRMHSPDLFIFSKFHGRILNQSAVGAGGLGIRKLRGFKTHQIWKRETACSCCLTKVCID